MANLLSPGCLPKGFNYPTEFVRVVGLGITDMEPWAILEGEGLLARYAGLQKRYPDRNVIPFAHRIDNDDVACWDLDRDARVVIVHDFASPGWERQGEFGGFYDWLRQAVEDLIEYDC
ncbi:hypothetical protein SAMN04487820_101493 [Actinopolyspora mzabensis]|uniref:SMI1-KNR4 cell-wall n=1 Tax=Actinopolyspora mzabensis TaxID=995066 RepID=A0A1G8W2H3_ACTMZ|nr:hypothetical protein [Actinopolyspora mzabensis]SDJ72502.1 hypothetical protein SAMN04487820_101493 [Actinopolyspora mzabensis]